MRTGTGRGRAMPRMLLAATLVLGVAVPAAADGFSSALGDDQGTGAGLGTTAPIPGLAWVTELPATEFNGSHGAGGVQGYPRPTVLAGDLAVIALDDTTAEQGGGETRDTLIAIDTTDGSVAWQVDDVDNDCPVVADADGTVWGLRQNAEAPEFELISIAQDGTVTQEFVREVGTPTDPKLVRCGETPLRLSMDGSQLLMWQDDTGEGVDEFLRVLDVSGDTVSQDAIIDLELTDVGGVFGGWLHEMRVSPTRDSVYLLERLAGVDPSCCGQDDVHNLHAIDLDGLPAESTITDAGIADRTVELPISQQWAASFTVLGDEILISGEEDLGGRVPADGDDVHGRMFRVVDDGSTLEVAGTEVGRTSPDARAPGEHNGFMVRLTGGDGDTLIGRAEGDDAVVGIDRVTLQQQWALDDLDCFNLPGTLVVDAAGNGIFHEYCDEAVVSVTPDGRVRWMLATGDDNSTGDVDEAIHPIVGTSDSYDLEHFGFASFSVDAVTADGRVIVTAETSDSASYSGVEVFAIDLGEAVERAAGTNRVETAVDISRTTYPGGAGVVVIAKAGDYPDALAGAPLALFEGGPLLLSSSGSLSAATAAEIARLGASEAILLGGEAALSDAVRTELEDDGLTVERVAGADRYDTARLVAERIGATSAVVVEGANANPLRGWPDAVAASSWAASTGQAILLVTATRVPDPTALALEDMTDVTIVGGVGAVPAAIADQVDDIAGTVGRIAGASRYETSRLVAERSVADGSSLDVVWLATGTGFADALTAGPAAALTSGVLLLVVLISVIVSKTFLAVATTNLAFSP